MHYKKILIGSLIVVILLFLLGCKQNKAQLENINVKDNTEGNDGKKYLEKIPNVNLVVFEESAHNIFDPNLEKFVNTVELFFKTIKS